MSGKDIGPLERLINATRYSLQGLRYAWATEPAFRYEIYVLAIALPVAWLVGKSAVERALLIGSVLLVVVVELVNSAIEATVNRIGRERHELSGRAKDLGSAAVFVAIVLAGAVWSTLLLG
ncbi:MAG: diacylglycerol kinase [Deltaproteobacteria bacterium]|nr:diacylglycerol kinase [Deltaproteobacteria bacterium]